MTDLLSLFLFAELLSGLLLFGQSIQITHVAGAVAPARKFAVNVEYFKLVLGFVLVLLASFGKAI